MIILAVVLIWLAYGFVAYGVTFAALQRGLFPSLAKNYYSSDRKFSLLFGFIFGPIALIVLAFEGDFKYGFKIK